MLLLPFFGQAQFGNLLKKAKDKITQRADSRVDKEMDKTLDQVEGKKQAGPSNSSTTAATETTAVENKPTIKSYSKFDFVAGEKVLYAEDFAQDNIGELPLTWNSSGKGEVQTIEGKEGKWLHLFPNTSYLAGNRRSFGENYTIEFDLIYYFNNKPKGMLPNWNFGLFTSGGIDPTDNSFLKEHSQTNSVEAAFGYGGKFRTQLKSKQNRQETFRSDLVNLWEEKSDWNVKRHYSIQVQKSRLRLWIDETKVYDIPRAVNASDTLNGMFFSMDGSNYKDDEAGLYITNIKVATGLPDTRHKLLDEGKFSTTGILFDVNAATIKPESAGVLKEIGTVLKENEGIKIKIIGHTDSDGSDAANLELSKKRSAAVKAALAADYGIDESRITTDGKGESQPVADNKTKEGKAQNRRVEFVKL